jgi:hypothetical protein
MLGVAATIVFSDTIAGLTPRRKPALATCIGQLPSTEDSARTNRQTLPTFGYLSGPNERLGGWLKPG